MGPLFSDPIQPSPSAYGSHPIQCNLDFHTLNPIHPTHAHLVQNGTRVLCAINYSNAKTGIVRSS